MPSFAEADLLPKFTALTGMQPDSPIPTYMRSDAKLFFTNFTVFRHPVGQAPSGAVPPAAPAFVATSHVDFATRHRRLLRPCEWVVLLLRLLGP
jgi:hypothetical protein